MNFSTYKTLSSILSLTVSLGLLAGCTNQNDSTKTTTPTPDTSQAAQPAKAPTPSASSASSASSAKPENLRKERLRRMRGARMGGPTMLLHTALNEKDLELTEEQKSTIEAAITKAEPEDAEPTKAPADSPFAVLVEEIRAGKVDPAAVVAKMTPDAAANPRHAAAVEALQTLHKTLTKEQRRKLVDQVEKQREEWGKRGERGERRERGKHEDKNPQAPGGENSKNTDPHQKRDHERGKHEDKKPQRGPMDGKGPQLRSDKGLGPMGFLLQDLELTDTQQDAIKKALAAQKPEAGAKPNAEAMKKHFEEMQATMKTRLESFASDNFDAKAFLSPPEGMESKGKQMMEQMAKNLAAIVPILEPAQREKLAASLEKNMGQMRGRGMGRPMMPAMRMPGINHPAPPEPPADKP